MFFYFIKNVRKIKIIINAFFLLIKNTDKRLAIYASRAVQVGHVGQSLASIKVFNLTSSVGVHSLTYSLRLYLPILPIKTRGHR